ncbi:MAG: 50S ribosomal protein P1 [Candidatus Thorarchaeota archaeon]|nr:50S ribosomal protein P1 [Candidatus Thorarchaeota archaeon]
MEYVYAALLLHKAGKKIDSENMEAVLSAADVEADQGRIKALIAALEGVDIEDALKSAAMPAAPAAGAGEGPTEEPAEEEEEEEEEEEDEDEATEGLGSLFG